MTYLTFSVYLTMSGANSYTKNTPGAELPSENSFRAWNTGGSAEWYLSWSGRWSGTSAGPDTGTAGQRPTAAACHIPSPVLWESQTESPPAGGGERRGSGDDSPGLGRAKSYTGLPRLRHSRWTMRATVTFILFLAKQSEIDPPSKRPDPRGPAAPAPVAPTWW